MILTVGSTKGGAGKSTLALNIAIARTLAGQAVWLVDGDKQPTSTTAISTRMAAGIEPGIACAHYPDGTTLRTQVKLQSVQFDDVIIDSGGRDSTSLRAALVISDVLLVPYLPRSFDVWALQELAEIIAEAQAVRDVPLKCFAVLNRADPGAAAADNIDARGALADWPVYTYLDAPIHDRKAFANAGGAGLSVIEFKPKNPDAVAEIEKLVSMLF
jgi:chromosome partitioning protein